MELKVSRSVWERNPLQIYISPQSSLGRGSDSYIGTILRQVYIIPRPLISLEQQTEVTKRGSIIQTRQRQFATHAENVIIGISLSAMLRH